MYKITENKYLLKEETPLLNTFKTALLHHCFCCFSIAFATSPGFEYCFSFNMSFEIGRGSQGIRGNLLFQHYQLKLNLNKLY